MNTTATRTLIAVVASFVIGFIIQVINGFSVTTALLGAVIFSIFVGVSVAILSWAGDYAERKGYPFWVGFLLVFFLNIIGIVILFLLPLRLPQRDV